MEKNQTSFTNLRSEMNKIMNDVVTKNAAFVNMETSENKKSCISEL